MANIGPNNLLQRFARAIGFAPPPLPPSPPTALEQALLIYSNAKAELLAAHPQIFDIPVHKEAQHVDYKNYLQINGVPNETTGGKLRDAIIYYLTTIENGKELLNAFKYGPITLHFHPNEGSYWMPGSRTIVINFSGDFKRLSNLFLNPPKLHINKSYHLPPEPDALNATLFEFHNAAWLYANKPEEILMGYPLMFQSAQEYGLFKEYVEFQAQSGGKPHRLILLKGDFKFLDDFNSWYYQASTVDCRFKEKIPHTAHYEAGYNAIYKKNRVSVFHLTKMLEQDINSAKNINIVKAQVQQLKIIMCPKVQKELELDVLEALIARVEKPFVKVEDEPKRCGCLRKRFR